MLTNSNNRFAVIDLGSHSFYMLLGVVLPSGVWQVVQQFTESVQLRAGLTPQGELSGESINRALTCLDDFSRKLTHFDPNRDKVRVVGTAALRLAQNRALFVSLAAKILHYPIEVISGQEEAELSYLAFFQYLQPYVRSKILGIDVGGGSTELVVGLEKAPSIAISLPIGSIELQRYFWQKGGITAQHFFLATKLISKQFVLADKAIQNMVDFRWQHAYAGSGSAELLAQVGRFLGFGTETEKEISLLSLRHIQHYLIGLQDYEQAKILGLKAHQLLILPGMVVIFLTLMTYLKLDKITVLPVALRHGVLAAMRFTALQLRAPSEP